MARRKSARICAKKQSECTAAGVKLMLKKRGKTFLGEAALTKSQRKRKPASKRTKTALANAVIAKKGVRGAANLLGVRLKRKAPRRS